MKNPLNELIGVLLTFYNMNIIYDTNIQQLIYVESCFTDDFFSSVNDSRFNVFGLSTSLRDGDEILLQFDMGDNSVKDGESGDSGLFFFDSDEDSGRGLRFASSFFHFIRRF